MSTTERKALGDISSAAAGKFPAAPETSTSMPPNTACACRSAAAVASGSRTSAASPVACAPSACSRVTAASTFSLDRLITATRAPAAANPSAIPRLMPLVPPATKTVVPLKSSVTWATVGLLSMSSTFLKVWSILSGAGWTSRIHLVDTRRHLDLVLHSCEAVDADVQIRGVLSLALVTDPWVI